MMTTKELLDNIHGQYHNKALISPDPLQFLHDYPDAGDREIVALIGALLAYGRVDQILIAVKTVLDIMNPSPIPYLTDNDQKKINGDFSTFKYRFTKGAEIAYLLTRVQCIVMEMGSLQTLFLKGLSLKDRQDNTLLPALTHFIVQLMDGDEHMGHLTPHPAKGSACKRLNLFLRWMVRKDNVDPGGWNEISPSMLIIPLDTHMHRIGQILGFTKRKQANMKTAMEITEGFRKICPEDPVKYDFSLTRFGIRQEMDMADLESLVGHLQV